jgi:hypothetical protein
MIAALAIGLLAGSAVGVEAQDGERAAPSEFTGHWSFEDQLVPDTSEVGNGWSGSRGGAYAFGSTDVTDPRFDGEVIAFTNWDDIGAYTIRRTAWRVENEDGAWQSEVLTGADFPDGSQTVRTYTFHGEGAYDGLTAIVEDGAPQEDQFDSDLRGVIIDFDLPPDPEPRSLQ